MARLLLPTSNLLHPSTVYIIIILLYAFVTHIRNVNRVNDRWQVAGLAIRQVGRSPWSGRNCNVAIFGHYKLEIVKRCMVVVLIEP